MLFARSPQRGRKRYELSFSPLASGPSFLLVQGQLVSTQLGVNTASFVPEAAKGESVTCPGKNTYEQFDRNEPGGSPTCKKAKVSVQCHNLYCVTE